MPPICFFESFSLKKAMPANAEKTILPPVTNGYNTVAGSEAAPKVADPAGNGRCCNSK